MCSPANPRSPSAAKTRAKRSKWPALDGDLLVTSEFVCFAIWELFSGCFQSRWANNIFIWTRLLRLLLNNTVAGHYWIASTQNPYIRCHLSEDLLWNSAEVLLTCARQHEYRLLHTVGSSLSTDINRSGVISLSLSEWSDAGGISRSYIA